MLKKKFEEIQLISNLAGLILSGFLDEIEIINQQSESQIDRVKAEFFVEEYMGCATIRLSWMYANNCHAYQWAYGSENMISIREIPEYMAKCFIQKCIVFHNKKLLTST